MRILWACAAATIFLPVAIARADGITIPEIQEGLWQVTMHNVNSPGNQVMDSSFKLCRNHAYDKRVESMVNSQKGCTLTLENIGGGKYTSTGRCTVAGSVLVSTAVITTTSTSSHTETQTTFTPAFYGQTSSTMIQDQKYLGACPAGMQPGSRAPG